jgi:3-deoxy-D-manno-octulosonic-acid transferase
MLAMILLLFYSLFLRIILIPVATLFRSLSDRIDKQLDGRSQIESVNFAIDLATKRRMYKKCFVFFCSSAGEYEQAKPVLHRLETQGIFTHTFLFSKSGLEFAKIRNERLSYSLCPIDYVWSWATLFAALRPTGVVIIRHEFWPGFLGMARKWCNVYILNGVPPAMLGREPYFKTYASSKFKRYLLGEHPRIFTSDKAGTAYYSSVVKFNSSQILEIGDTKFDRVIERVAGIKDQALKRATKIKSSWIGDQPIMILGSAHLPDLEFVLKAFSKEELIKWKFLIVPHDLSSKNISQMNHILKDYEIKTEWFSEVEVLILDHEKTSCQAIIVDSMGQLSELYAVADLAWVGGAVHAKIHNVLEPAVWGLPISCGTRYKNSQEAIVLVENRLISPIDDPKNAVQIWNDQLNTKERIHTHLHSRIQSLAGASERFVSYVTNN